MISSAYQEVRDERREINRLKLDARAAARLRSHADEEEEAPPHCLARMAAALRFAEKQPYFSRKRALYSPQRDLIRLLLRSAIGTKGGGRASKHADAMALGVKRN